MSTQDLDTQLAETFRVIANSTAYPRPGRGRSIRPGKNALRRMKLGRLVQDYRVEISERQRTDLSDRSWKELADELDRRQLPQAARQVREGDHRGEMAITTVMASSTLAVLSIGAEKFTNEDQQNAELERMIDSHAEELGSAELPAELDRERDALSEAEYIADLEEVGADQAAIDAELFASEIAGDQPGVAMNPYSGLDSSSEQSPQIDLAENVEVEL